jgi:uncharacterized protein (DUF1697 family)
MPNRHIALLRGINVGGHNRVPMATLREMFVEAGATEVATYIQSGNVVFAAPAKRAGPIAAAVRAAITEQLGLAVPLVVRSAAAMAKVARAHPFADRVPDPKFLMVAFLDAKPSASKVAALDPNRSPNDRFEVRGADVYLAYPNGSGRSKLDAAWLDRSLGVVSTTRNWLTVHKLVEMSGATTAP